MEATVEDGDLSLSVIILMGKFNFRPRAGINPR